MKMNPVRKRAILAASTIVLVLVTDQIIKYLVKTNMSLYETIDITSWFKICFVENRGMAFGMDFIGTSFLSLFRIAAILLFAYWLVNLVLRKYPLGFIFCFSLIFAGALGNIVDNCLYGLIFEESQPVSWGGAPAQLVEFGKGYGDFLSGKVVDMFYFPLFTWPDSVPWLGGKVFFGAIFNFADAAISCGAVALVIFYYRHLTKIQKLC